jgi:hypothetical protein
MRTSVLEEEELGIADCDFGDGRDVACGNDGVISLVWLATLPFKLTWTSLAGVLFGRESQPRRKATFRKMLIVSLCGSMFLSLSFSFPLVVLASSSTMCGVGGSFFDHVAVRRLCSSVDRNF